jgi:hypothetical protein
VVVVAAAALVVTAIGALTPPGGSIAPAPAAAATLCGGPVSDGQVRVVVVVDDGGAQGARATCLVVPRGTTGSQLLAERAAALGVSRPRYADSGLLCAIDGFPASGCGEATAGGYRYWAYFSGTSGSWLYGGGNPFIRRIADGDIEGWRFVEGTGTGADPPPRLAPSSGLFPALPPPPTPSGPPPPPAAAPAPAPPSPSSSTGAGPGPQGPTAAPSGPATGTDPTTTIAAPVADATDPTTVDAAAETGDGDEMAATPAAATSSSADGPGPWGLVVAGVLIAALVGATLVRARARR